MATVKKANTKKASKGKGIVVQKNGKKYTIPAMPKNFRVTKTKDTDQ